MRRIAVVLIFAAAILAMCADRRRPARRAGDFGNLEPITIRGWSDDVMEPFITRDGYLLFNDSNAPGRDTNLHYATPVDERTFDYRGQIVGVNSAALDAVATVDTDGVLYFVSTRSYTQTLSTIYRGRFSAGLAGAVQLVPGVSRLQPGFVQFDVEVSADGSTLYLSEGFFRTGAVPESADLLLARRDGDQFVRPSDGEVLAKVNSNALEYAAAISANGLELFFTRLEPGGIPTIWRASRPNLESPFGPPSRLEAASGFVEAPALSADQRSLYFHRREGDRFVLYRLRR